MDFKDIKNLIEELKILDELSQHYINTNQTNKEMFKSIIARVDSIYRNAKKITNRPQLRILDND